MAASLDFFLYIDDAHGTSIFGNKGEGFVLSNLDAMDPNLIVTFSMSKGYGCNGGGVILPSAAAEQTVRRFGQIYAFSAALDFTVVGGAIASEELHRSGLVRELQNDLRKNVKVFDDEMMQSLPFSPLRSVGVETAEDGVQLAKSLLNAGFFCSAFFFPSVARDSPQIRICLAANHTQEQIQELCKAIRNAPEARNVA